ncbi:hypothetical protein QFC22_001706 [Naganishia vaughanmartiniae]|uniref:Uncharacterized protein n=1 Tax=Naganishia vaughanmartiniae TaxID=1424756 RepID=A0ACC2XF98_9TREE|nr:hypothetical protein QFC22_001706 [Naganishia vaughanmartiniae]
MPTSQARHTPRRPRNCRTTFSLLLTLSSATLTHTAAAAAVEPRWGQKAAYVPSHQSIYFIGGQVSSWNGSTTAAGVPSITNEILVLNLTTDNPQFSTGVSQDLPPTAFHTVTYAAKTHQLVSVGGLTGSCSGDTIAHTFDLEGAGRWRSVGVKDLVRRRGMGSGYSEKDDQVMVVGGLADEYVCCESPSFAFYEARKRANVESIIVASSTYSYPAYDLLPVPMSSATTVQTSSFSYANPSTSDPQLGVIDFSLTRLANDTFLLAGGADSSGSLVPFDTVGLWDSTAGWRVAQTSGEVPAPRVGHNMMPHPTLDLLVLHGGATNTANLSSTASTTLAFLNTTTLTWTQPSNLQPPTSFARAWHSSVMVDSGVLVTAFGLSAKGEPRNDIVYLDMRNTDSSKWGWKAVWSKAMLEVPLITSNNSNDDARSTQQNNKTLKSILIPVLIFLALGIPCAVWLLRRHVKNVRHRRMAQHFEMDPEEDTHSRGGATSVLGQFFASRFGSSRDAPRRPSLSKPFGGVRINEKGQVVGNNASDNVVVTHLKDLFKRVSYGSFKSFDTMESTAQDREMTEIRAGVAAAMTANSNGQPTEKTARHQWEEIDFGLGKLDESRRNSSIPRSSASFDESRRRRSEYNEKREGDFVAMIPEVKFEGPFGDEFQVEDTTDILTANTARLSPPALVILPPSQPTTPSIDSDSHASEFTFTGLPSFVDSPINDDSSDSVIRLERGATGPTRGAMKDEWESLADSLVSHPIFGSSPPATASTANLTRTLHDDSKVGNTMTAPPPLVFQQRRASGPGTSGLGVSPSFSPSTVGALRTNRSVSQPITSPPGRDLISPLSSSGRRSGSGSDDFADYRTDAKVKAANRVSASGIYDKFRSPYVETTKSRPVSSYTPEQLVAASPSSVFASTKRYSTPPFFPPPNSPPPVTPQEHSQPATQYSHEGIERHPSKRTSRESKLRVVNMTPDMANGRNEWEV